VNEASTFPHVLNQPELAARRKAARARR